jgi:hypothetical protein
MPPKPEGPAIEIRHVSTRTPGCVHRFGPVVRGRYAAWVRRCLECGGVATVRASGPVARD